MYLSKVSKNTNVFIIPIVILLIISVTKSVVGGKYLQNYGTGIFKNKSKFGENFYNNIARINEDISSLTRTLSEIKQYIKNDGETSYDNENIITKRVSKNIKTHEDSDSYSHLHVSRCYFNPVSC